VFTQILTHISEVIFPENIKFGFKSLFLKTLVCDFGQNANEYYNNSGHNDFTFFNNFVK